MPDDPLCAGCRLYIDLAQRTGPVTPRSSSPASIEKAPSVWRCLWERLFLYKLTDFLVTDDIDSKHEQEQRQPPEDARPIGRRGQQTTRIRSRSTNQCLLRELAELPDRCSARRRNNRHMKAAIPFHRRSSNTSAPPETLTEEEK